MNSIFKVQSADSEKYVKSRPLKVKSSKNKRNSNSANESFYVFGESDISDDEILYESCEMQDVRCRTSNQQFDSNANANNDINTELNTEPSDTSRICYNLKAYKDVSVDDWDVFDHQIQQDDSLQNLSIKYSVPVSMSWFTRLV